MSAPPTPEQLRQRVNAVSLAKFLATPVAEREFLLSRWRAEARGRQNHASPMVRLEARERLARCDSWEAFASNLSDAPALPTAA